MSDPKGDRPDTPETSAGAAGDRDVDASAATPSSDGQGDGAGTTASVDPADLGDLGEAPDDSDDSGSEPARAEDVASSEEPETSDAPAGDGDDAQDDVSAADEPAADEPVVDDESARQVEPPAGEDVADADDADDELPPPGKEPPPVEPAPEPADREPDDVPGGDGGTGDAPDVDAPGTTPTAPSGWRRLGAALRPRASRSQVLAGVLCAALGFALVVQVQQSASDQLSSARQEDLVRLLDEVTDRAQQLGDEVSGLEATRDELESGSGQARSALELAQQRAESEGILSGRLPAQGPGVRVTIQDPAGALKASQMFNVLEELRNAGAEVVELNGVRLVTSTWFEDEGDAIVVDGTALSSPYEWTVIGDPETMDRALEIPGGALATVRTAGAEASTAREDEVKITAVTPPQEPEYAQPERERG